eukprot:s171_g41.t1
MKSATLDFFTRLLHLEPGSDPCWTYDIAKIDKGAFQCTLRLSELARTAAGLRSREYQEEAAPFKEGLEAELPIGQPPLTRSPPLRGRLWGFDMDKYGQNMKTATIDFFARLFHSEPGGPQFGTYETQKDVDGNFQSTLQLSEKARTAAGLRNWEYKGELCRTKPEAEQSASRLLWEDPNIREKAAKLPPSKKARRQKKRAAEASAKRKALYGYGTGVERIVREDRKGVKSPWLHLLGVAVDAAHRRRGLAQHLLRSALRGAAAAGAVAALLHVRVENHAAQRLYRRLGTWGWN